MPFGFRSLTQIGEGGCSGCLSLLLPVVFVFLLVLWLMPPTSEDGSPEAPSGRVFEVEDRPEREGPGVIGPMTPPPSAEEMADDVVDGLDQAKRREIYAAMRRVERGAAEAAEHHYPTPELPANRDAARAVAARLRDVYQSARRQGRDDLLDQYGIDGATLDRIESEGDAKRWPSGGDGSRP